MNQIKKSSLKREKLKTGHYFPAQVVKKEKGIEIQVPATTIEAGDSVEARDLYDEYVKKHA